MKLPFSADLSNETVAITGGGGVLMSEFAKALAACGAKVGIIDLNEESCKRVADEIIKDGGKAIPVPADCMKKDSVLNAKGIIEANFGKVTLLINGAGGNNAKAQTDIETIQRETTAGIKTFFDLDESGFKFVYDLNILTAVICTQVFAEDMVKSGYGNIINISSMNAFRPLTKIPAYSSAKAGVSNFTQWLAVHFAPAGIRCNAIAPGFFATKQNEKLLFDENGASTARTGKILAGTPMKRLGKPSDLIGTLLWLASTEASGFVTGTVIPVDGGFSAYSGV